MDTQKAKQLADYIFKDVFAVENTFSLDELQKKFAFDIPLPKKVKSALSKKETWTNTPDEKVASQEDVGDRFKKDEWSIKKRPLNSMKDVLDAWDEINYLTGEKYINSKETIESDGVYNSIFVYKSMSIFDSKNIILCYKNFDCNYMLASRDNSSCTLGIRMKENIFCSSGFEVSWSNKVSRCMYVHDSFDLFECLFCSHMRSKKYCIANMQFEKEEYLKIKKMVTEWIIKG